MSKKTGCLMGPQTVTEFPILIMNGKIPARDYRAGAEKE